MQEPSRIATSAPGPPPWRRALEDAVRDPDELVTILGLPDALRAPARRAAKAFGLLVPRSYLSRIRPGDPEDPLLRQVLPLGEELEERPGFVADPLAEASKTLAPGLLVKYRGRALLLAAPACAIHCRYCFRRHFPYGEAGAGAGGLGPALGAIRSDPTVREVILSGGDPLALPDPALAELARRLEAIPHLTRLRIHTRLPIAIPERVCNALLSWLAGTRIAVWVVVHANHPREIDGAVAAALERFRTAGIPVLNQSVLLKGVNDDVEVLAELCERLADLGVRPYYLHQLDPVAGAAHFFVPVERGRALVEALRARLPGYAVPRYVQEKPGESAKTPLA